MAQLSKSSISISFITPENVRSPWVHYEAGVIAGKTDLGTICPYLVGVKPNQVRDTPLGQFQCTSSDKPDTFRLIQSINDGVGERRHDERLLTGNYNQQWPRLKRQLEKVMETLSPIDIDVLYIEPPIEQKLSDEGRSFCWRHRPPTVRFV